MANVFGILTAIVLAVSAFLAMKNKAAYKEEIATRGTAQRDLATTQDRLSRAQANLESTRDERSGVETETAQLQEQQAEAEAANKALGDQISTVRGQVESNEQKLEDLRAKIAEIGDLPELAAELRAAQAELEELSQLTASAEATLANLTSQNERIDQVIAGLRSESEMVSRGESFPTLRTRISSVYPSWGFVTLAAGNNAGVVPNSVLNVVRDGETIGKLVVTAVEANTASASIIPDSVSEDVTLSVGDQVVPGRRAAANRN